MPSGTDTRHTDDTHDTHDTTCGSASVRACSPAGGGRFRYKTDDADVQKSVRHYLVQPEDTAGAKKTLPDFLFTCPAFQFLLVV